MANPHGAEYDSESEDESFNPPPDTGSDNEAKRENGVEDIKSSQDASREANEEEDDDHGSVGERSSVRLDENHGGEGEGNAAEAADGRRGHQDGDEGEEDEVDEDDDEDEDAISGRPRKRARRDPRNQFLDVEAEVSEDDEGDEEDDELMPDGFIADTHPDDLADLPAGAENDDRRHRELDRKREMEASMDAERQAQALKERHHNYLRSRPVGTDSLVVPKRLLLPSVDDPSIWGVKCKPGKERDVVFSIMRRVEERANTKQPLPIISALERGGTMAGYVYIEARRQTDVLAALDGLLNVYPRTKMVLVPIKEMPDLLRVTKTAQLEPGGYVRVKRGKYAGDLAQIDEVETNGLIVTLKIVPRLDYGNKEDLGAPARGANADKRKRPGLSNSAVARPPQRLFSEVEARKNHAKNLTLISNLGQKHFQYMSDTYINGYLIKDFKIQHLVTENVNPKLEEVTKFAAGASDGTENLDLAALAASLKNAPAEDGFVPGDVVEVFEGEQKGVTGKTISVVGNIVTLSVTEGNLKGQRMDVPVKGLRKRFTIGDHVKVIGGSKFRDEVGMVVRIRDDRVTILSDISMQEITVFSKDLREATDSGGVAGGTGKYDIHDLVQLDPATVACVIKVDRESLRVLDQTGSIRSILPSQITNKLQRRRHAFATDCGGSEIRLDDTVKEFGGDRRQGTILHIYRTFLFLLNRESNENAGVFVARSSNVQTVAAKGRLTDVNAPDLTKMNPALQRNGGNMLPPPPRSFGGRDRTIGQTVTIRKGPYKGLLGIVKDTTDLEARVELHTKGVTITVLKETLNIKDPISGKSIEPGHFGSRMNRNNTAGGFAGGRTPVSSWSGSRTPAGVSGLSSRTPAWQSSSARTPAWTNANSTARTPTWKAVVADGSRTANPYDGNRTAYNGASMSSAKTPAWNPSARTPFNSSGDGSQTFDAFVASSKTPAYHSDYNSSRTPAWGASSKPSSLSAFDAPTPAAAGEISAPTPNATIGDTPSAAYSAPTPAAFTAPTPGASAATPRWGPEAPTPGPNAASVAKSRLGISAYDAPTPGEFQAPTPGVWNNDAEDEEDADEGPRYAEATPSP